MDIKVFTPWCSALNVMDKKSGHNFVNYLKILMDITTSVLVNTAIDGGVVLHSLHSHLKVRTQSQREAIGHSPNRLIDRYRSAHTYTHSQLDLPFCYILNVTSFNYQTFLLSFST